MVALNEEWKQVSDNRYERDVFIPSEGNHGSYVTMLAYKIQEGNNRNFYGISLVSPISDKDYAVVRFSVQDGKSAILKGQGKSRFISDQRSSISDCRVMPDQFKQGLLKLIDGLKIKN